MENTSTSLSTRKRSVGAIVSLLLIVLFFSTSVVAETIILKSGMKIEAKIIRRTDQRITIDFHGTPVTYNIYEIESIGEGKAAFSSSHGRDAEGSPKAEFDKELLNFGIRFIPPMGWQKVKLPDTPSAIYYTQADKKANICIALPRKANEASFNLSLAMLKIAKKPISEEEITFSGVPCYIFVIEQINKAGMKVKTKDYQFFKNGKVYSIGYSSDDSGFYYYLPEFEKALDTFELLK